MAPLSTEPRQLLVVLNGARRKAYYTLVVEITAYMRSQIELPQSSNSSAEESPARETSAADAPPASSSSSRRQQHKQQQGNDDVAPLFVPRGGDADSSSPRLQQDDADLHVGAQQRQEQRRAPPSLALIRLRKAALAHFDAWRAEVLAKLKEVVASPDDPKILEARRKRVEILAKRKTEEPAEGEDLLSFGEGPSNATTADASEGGEAQGLPAAQQVAASTLNVSAFQSVYHPIPTRLTTIPLDDRKEVMSSMLLLLLAIGNYSAYSRTLTCYIASAMEIPPTFLDNEEIAIATTMVESVQKADAMSAEAEAQKRREAGQSSRFWKVGLASVAGAAVIGITGGLAAPVVAGAIGGLMGGVGLGGLASFLGIFWMNGALVGTIFGAFGAGMTGQKVDQYAKEVEDFRFLPLKAEWGGKWKKDSPDDRRLRVTIGVNGWLKEAADVTKPWRALGDESEVFALRYEMESLLSLGTELTELVSSYAWGAIKSEILKRTVLVTLWSALWPAYLIGMATNVDNPFSLARNRSEKAGKVLADALINKVQGERPVTLVGYSLGARVIYSCLRSLAERKAFGLVDSVVLVAAPVPSNTGHWQMMRTVVSGKLFNVYSENDYILAFLYRTTSAQLGIAGLQAISDEVEGVENLDLSAEVTGHLRYPELMPKILTRCGFPNVKDGQAAIEKEQDAILLHNDDFAEMGKLIDIDDKAQIGPSKHSERDMANEKFDPNVKLDQKQKTSTAVRDDKLAGVTGAEGSKAIPANTREQTVASAASSTAIRESTHVTAGSASHMGIPPPPYTEFETGSDFGSEEDGFTGIQMEDSDDEGDMVVYTEALRLEE
ncbi:YSIRK family gram-positive signal peptide [Apiospora kogelbergensis]|uniref:YSIRK family gram-positive signal peptide n=1 Tax=Apiospora kogelbergensis TaxID=1337665 RepID=A0AAW0RCF9_9PEZI